MSHTPARDIVDYLNTNVAALTKGTNLFPTTILPAVGQVPINAVFAFGIGGAGPGRSMGEVSEFRTPIVNVRVRNASFNSGDIVTRAIMDALQAASISGYLDVVALDSEPLANGQDDDGRYLWTQSFLMRYKETK